MGCAGYLLFGSNTSVYFFNSVTTILSRILRNFGSVAGAYFDDMNGLADKRIAAEDLRTTGELLDALNIPRHTQPPKTRCTSEGEILGAWIRCYRDTFKITISSARQMRILRVIKRALAEFRETGTISHKTHERVTGHAASATSLDIRATAGSLLKSVYNFYCLSKEGQEASILNLHAFFENFRGCTVDPKIMALPVVYSFTDASHSEEIPELSGLLGLHLKK